MCTQRKCKFATIAQELVLLNYSRISHLLPPYVHLPGRANGIADHIEALLVEHIADNDDWDGKMTLLFKSLLYHLHNSDAYASVMLNLYQSNDTDAKEWWNVRMLDPSFDPKQKQQHTKLLPDLEIIAFADKVRVSYIRTKDY
jgi:hypothetical protein